MVFNVVILSIHGYFGQANVLGLPNTGGQIVYILDQVRALENEMLLKLKHQGLDIKPRILIVTRLIPDAKGTSCNQLLERVSETEHTGILLVPFRIEKGILRKCIWPYLEKFAEDAASEIYAELYGAPDFIIGNCSEGNLVASLLSYKMGVTQCTLAHALEKIKYPDSDLYWKKFDEKYHFSCQFTAVLLAMNNEDFIINGTFKKIAGPGNLSDPSKPMVFSMARLDCVKNITGLFEWYAKNNKIRELAKLVVVADYNNMARCDEYQLKQTALKMMNERGIFVQPSFYEAFGLTVVEAMTCGLPKSVTCYGGPAEIIEDGVSGFHIDPYLPNNAAVTMVNFFQECKKDTNYWVKISESGLKRIYERHMEDLL